MVDEYAEKGLEDYACVVSDQVVLEIYEGEQRFLGVDYLCNGRNRASSRVAR